MKLLWSFRELAGAFIRFKLASFANDDERLVRLLYVRIFGAENENIFWKMASNLNRKIYYNHKELARWTWANWSTLKFHSKFVLLFGKINGIYRFFLRTVTTQNPVKLRATSKTDIANKLLREFWPFQPS